MKTTCTDLAHERCQYRTRTGRQCTSHVVDPESSNCSRHAAAEPRDYEDFETTLTHSADHFLNAQGINYSLATLYRLLASGRISPRRASVLAYISNLLLRSLSAIDQDKHPEAGKDAAKLPRPGQSPVNPSGLPVRDKEAFAGMALPSGKTPLPKTGAEFAKQVFTSLKQQEHRLPNYVLKNPNYIAATADLPTPKPAPTPTSSNSAPPTSSPITLSPHRPSLTVLSDDSGVLGC
jgi:hypothetical protein